MSGFFDLINFVYLLKELVMSKILTIEINQKTKAGKAFLQNLSMYINKHRRWMKDTAHTIQEIYSIRLESFID